MKTTTQQQIKLWADIYEQRLVNEDVSVNNIEQNIDKIENICKQQLQKYSSQNERFNIFEFEGQQLKNIWEMLYKMCENLKSSEKFDNALFYFGKALSNLINVNSHNMPKPTDPRDIR